MARYKLTERTYNTLIGRGYKLTCKHCGCALEKDVEIESKPSRYWKWKCEECGWSSRRKPKRRKRIGRIWLFECPKCGGTVYRIGRKFYCADCYDSLFHGGNNNSADGP